MPTEIAVTIRPESPSREQTFGGRSGVGHEPASLTWEGQALMRGPLALRGIRVLLAITVVTWQWTHVEVLLMPVGDVERSQRTGVGDARRDRNDRHQTDRPHRRTHPRRVR